MDIIVFSMILRPPMLPIPPNKIHGYYRMFNDSEPAHAPHPTKQIMKNARILLYGQWLWPRPRPPSHRTNHENVWILLYFQWFWAMLHIPPIKSWKMQRNYWVRNVSGPPMLPTPRHKSWKIRNRNVTKQCFRNGSWRVSKPRCRRVLWILLVNGLVLEYCSMI